MKRTIIFLFMNLSLGVFAQNILPADLTTPDYSGDVVIYNTDTKQTLPLERPGYKSSTSGGEFGAKTVKVAEGEKSDVRIKQSDNIRFFMKWQSIMGMDINPADVVSLGKFEIKKGKRQVTTSKSKSGLFSFKSETNEDYKIRINFKKMGSEVVEVILSGKLPAGEYFFDTSMSTMCFGVD